MELFRWAKEMMKSMQTSVKSKVSSMKARIWLAYFLMTIAIIGFFLCSLLYFPLYFLGQQRACDSVLRWGIDLLLRLQPWLKAEIHLQLPIQVPKQGVLLVSNHRSHLDVFILLSQISGIRILAKKSLFRIPFLNIMMLATQQIPVPRDELSSFFQAMDEVKKRLAKGQIVHVFPEMTRCTQGFQGVRNFSSAPFQAASLAKVPVVPIVFKDTDQVWPKGFAGLFFRRSIQIHSLPPVLPEHFSSVESLKSAVQKQIELALL
jgi:1-acyl-sn-glycerol-3-phosphate acyltransferase